jgi:hypothetical protein
MSTVDAATVPTASAVELAGSLRLWRENPRVTTVEDTRPPSAPIAW